MKKTLRVLIILALLVGLVWVGRELMQDISIEQGNQTNSTERKENKKEKHKNINQ